GREIRTWGLEERGREKLNPKGAHSLAVSRVVAFYSQVEYSFAGTSAGATERPGSAAAGTCGSGETILPTVCPATTLPRPSVAPALVPAKEYSTLLILCAL